MWHYFGLDSCFSPLSFFNSLRIDSTQFNRDLIHHVFFLETNESLKSESKPRVSNLSGSETDIRTARPAFERSAEFLAYQRRLGKRW